MASACVNPIVDTSSSPSWFSPRMSFSRDFVIDQDPTKSPRNGDVDFEFFVRDPANNKISPADELFLNGKIMPLQITSKNEDDAAEAEADCEKIVINEIFEKGNSASPKAPKCCWKEFLGLKRSQNSNNIPKSDAKSSKSLKFFRSKSSSSSSTMNLPLLRDVDVEAELVSTSSRLSLSSSSSGGDHEDLPRLSLDSGKPRLPKLKVTPIRPKLQKSTARNSRQGVRTGRTATRRAPSDSSSRGVSVDSPRMNSSGKIVFHGLERSSSSPSSFNGGPRLKQPRGMERSYSANVRIRPVLNVPVCSLRGSAKSGSVFGFGQLFSSQKKDGASKNQGIKRNGSGGNRGP